MREKVEPVTLTMEDGKKFTIEAKGNSPKNAYIQSATLNGKPYSKNFITYSDIVNGGDLTYKMGSGPAMDRGVELEDRPYSVSTSENPN